MTNRNTTTDFFSGSYDAQIKAMTHLAREALAFYDLEDAEVELTGYTNNAVFTVIDSNASHVSGAKYILRVHRPGLKHPAWVRSEMVWLSAIRHYTDLTVPEPAGAPYHGQLPGVHDPVLCVLLGWVPGMALPAEEISLAQFGQIGEFLGDLHQFSVSYIPPEEFERPSLDWEGLFGENSPYRSAEETRIFTSEQNDHINEAATYIQQVMNALHKEAGSYALIHGDLIAKNILFDGEEVGAVDFDDCAWGYTLYDLTPVLWGCRNLPHYGEIVAALWQGYTRIRPDVAGWKDWLEALVLARHIASMRWVAQHADHPDYRGKVAGILAERTQEIARFFKSGSIARH